MSFDKAEVLNRFEGHGVQFDYPGFWELTEENDGDDVLITVSADGACFWALRVLTECPEADEVVNSCVAVFLEEYDDAEVHEVKTTLAQKTAFSREVTFSCFELLNSVSFTSVRSTNMTLLAWWQGTDHELEEARPLFEQITKSVRILSLTK